MLARNKLSSSSSRARLSASPFKTHCVRFIRCSSFFYTAISLQRYLTPIAPLTSRMVLALGYGNIVLPGSSPSSTDSSAMFWLRVRPAQSQMRKQTQSPLLLGRAQILNAELARQAKMFAQRDDETDGTLPPSPPRTHRQPALAQGPVPSVAISHFGRSQRLVPTGALPAHRVSGFCRTLAQSQRRDPGSSLRAQWEGLLMGRFGFPSWTRRGVLGSFRRWCG
ncbi:hypothetical protein B0H12DRAFT_721574 [Mycena haematopus]|nr:hypothetical protein B0H12DRAFT_721574 [Mycena haematopus]